MDLRLLEASENGDLSTVRKLMKTLPQVNVNVKDDLRCSALSKACKGGHFAIAKLLIDAQADVNVVDANRLTPLHFATKGEHVEVVKLLLLSGAKLNPENYTKLRPTDLVSYKSECREILQDAQHGLMPEIEEVSEVPIIPDYALPSGTTKKKKATGKKKGKKGKSKKGKKGGKKKGKKKK